MIMMPTKKIEGGVNQRAQVLRSNRRRVSADTMMRVRSQTPPIVRPARIDPHIRKSRSGPVDPMIPTTRTSAVRAMRIGPGMNGALLLYGSCICRGAANGLGTGGGGQGPLHPSPEYG